MEKADLFNIKLDIHDFGSVLQTCAGFYDSGRCHTLYFLNAHCFNLAQKNEQYRQYLNRADLLLNDGVGISIASRLAGIKLLANVNGSDLTPMLLEQAAALGKKVYLLGSEPGVTEKTKMVLEERYPEILICGHHHGFLTEGDAVGIVAEINRCGAELLVVGMGVPRQEFWIEQYRHSLKSVRIAIGGGATMNFMSGHIKRAPVWMRRLKIEWLHRWLREPRRMTKRYLWGNMLFFYYVFSRWLRLRK